VELKQLPESLEGGIEFAISRDSSQSVKHSALNGGGNGDPLSYQDLL
jgi:hypothetical protein